MKNPLTRRSTRDKSWHQAAGPALAVITRPESGRERISASRARYAHRRRAADAVLRLTGAVVLGLTWLAIAWVLMITVQIAHHSWWHAMPAMSFTTAAALAFWPCTAAIVIWAVLGWLIRNGS